MKAFHQIPVHPEDVPKTVIITPLRLYKYVRMPFGLRNAAQSFQRFIGKVLRGLPFCFAYIDDFLIASNDVTFHKQHLQQVFTWLQDYGIQVNLNKSILGVTSIDFLGHTVTSTGVTPHHSKFESIMQFPKPLSQRKLQEFLGMINFYNRYIPHSSLLLQPLCAMLKPSERGQLVTLSWT